MLSSLPGLNARPFLFFYQVIYRLHGPPMSVDKTDFGLVLYNHANFNRFEETSSYWSVETNISFSLLFIGQPATHLLYHSV